MITARVRPNPRFQQLGKLFDLDKSVMDDVVRDVDVEFRKHERKLFDSEGAEGGTAWRALSPEYKKRKDRQFAQANAFIRDQAKVRGRKLSGAALRKARGSDNKILQLTADMKKAFSTEQSGTSVHDGYEGVAWGHIAEAFKLAKNWFLRLGAYGPGYFGIHAEDAGRNPLQHTDEQWGRYFRRMTRTMIPHVMRRVRALDALRRRAA